jgi:RNA polymerase sigma-70 factor (ECF subfamily)
MADFPPTRVSLLLRLRDPRDGEAWRQFVELYAPLVYGYLRRQGLQDADAADLCQDVFAAVAGAIGRLHYDPAKGAFHNWLFTVVRNRLSNWLAAQGRRVQASGDRDSQRLLEMCPAPGGMEAEWEAEWEARLIAWASAQTRRQVSEASWQAFWLTYVEGRPVRQVAADLGLTAVAVYHARGRILARLKELIRSALES